MATCPECSTGDHSNHQPSLAGICIGCECPEVVMGPPAATVSDAGAHTGGLNGAMAHHGAAAVASIALPAEHVFAHLRSITVRACAIHAHVQDNRAAQLHLDALLATMRELVQEIADAAFLSELAARQTKALTRLINAREAQSGPR